MFPPDVVGFFSAAGLFVNTYWAAEEDKLILGATLAAVADAKVDDILAVSAARLPEDNLLSVMTALITF